MAEDPSPPFDPEALRRGLRPLDSASPATLSDAERAYLRHYGINFQVPGMSHHFGTVGTADHVLAVHAWVPTPARGTVVVVHGYYDHTGLYGHLIRHLIEQDFAVLAFDLPGHGLSSGEPATIDSFDHYVAALEASLGAMEAHLPGPAILLGQSTGGAVAMEWLLAGGYRRDTNPFAGVVLLAPLVRPYRWPLTRVYYEVARHFVAQRPRAFRGNSGNPEFLQFLRDADPLQARVLPVAWVTAMQRWRRRFERYPPTDIAPLVVQGQRDTTVDSRYGLRVIARLFEPRLFLVPEAGHHLVNEIPELRTQIFQAIDGELAGATRP